MSSGGIFSGRRRAEDHQVADQRAGRRLAGQHAAEQLLPLLADGRVAGQLGAEDRLLPVAADGRAGGLGLRRAEDLDDRAAARRRRAAGR